MSISTSKILQVVVIISIILVFFANGSTHSEMNYSGISCSNSQINLPLVSNSAVKYFDGPFEEEDNDSPSQANGPLINNKDYFGKANGGDQYDVFSVFLHTGGTINVDIHNHVVGGGQLHLYYAPVYPTPIATPDKSPPDYHIKLLNAVPGLYYIVLGTDLNKSIDPSETYTLTVQYPIPPTIVPVSTLPPIPTCIPTATSTPTPIPGGAPLCDYPELSGINYVAKFDGTKIVANSTPDMARTNPVTITIPPGNYQVILSSYDDHLARTPQPDQTAESWFLILYNSQGEIIATTEPIPDLPDNQDCFIGVVNENLAINDTVFSVVGFHSEYPPYPTPPPSNSNSVAPAYAVLGEITGNSLMATPPLLAATPDLSASATPTPTRWE